MKNANIQPVTLQQIIVEQQKEIQSLRQEIIDVKKSSAISFDRQFNDIRSAALFPMESPYPQLRISLSGEILFENPASYVLEAFSYQEQDFVAAELWKFIGTNFPADNAVWMIEVQSGESYYTLHCRIFRQEEYINIYGTDISDRKRAEQQMAISKKRYKDLFNYSQALICAHDLDGRIITVNPSICKLLEYTEDELKNTYLSDFLPNGINPAFFNNYLSSIQNGKTEGIFSVITKSGKKKYLLYQNFLVKEANAEPYVIGFSQDITGRHLAEEALKKSEEKYRGIIENMKLGLFELDKDGYLQFANESFCHISGYALDEMVGKLPAKLFLKEESLREFEDKMVERKAGLSHVYQLMIKTKTGEARWLLISGAPLYDYKNEFDGSIAIVIDITEQKAVEEKLHKANREAEQSSMAKDVFMANMSHEIRTPMNAIVGLARQMQKTPLSAQQKIFIDSISAASSNLLVIINEILDFSKIEAGKLMIEQINFKLEDVICNAINIVASSAEDKSIQLNTHLDEDLFPVLLGDPFRINQILINLLSNSIKFTEKGSITISCAVRNIDSCKQIVHISVTDTGKGMSPEYMSRLFDKFTQEDESITRKYGGTGLGMSIIRQLVELMHGEILVQSEQGKGTKVLISIPFTKGSVEKLPTKEQAQINTDILKGKKILLVEDNEMNRLVAKAVLEPYEVIIDEAENGLLALGCLKNKNYDIVLMDMRMPVMDGIYASAIIRKEMSEQLPVIALTANATKADQQKCLEAGMNDFISKPFEEEHLVQVLTKWLGQETILDTKKETNEDSQFKLFNLNTLKKISRGNLDFEKKMLAVFVRECNATITGLEDACQQNDIEKIISVSHKIKTSLRNMNVDSIKADLVELETSSELHNDKHALKALVDKVNLNMQDVIKEIMDNNLI